VFFSTCVLAFCVYVWHLGRVRFSSETVDIFAPMLLAGGLYSTWDGMESQMEIQLWISTESLSCF
jgi:hypothetical protein